MVGQPRTTPTEHTAPLARWRNFRPEPAALAYIILAVVWAYSLWRISGYRSWSYNMFTLRTTAFLVIVSTGQTLVVLMGGFDLSVAAVISLAGVVGGNLIHEFGQVPGILLTLGIVALVGAFNGVGVVTLRLPPLVMTLATMSIIEGGLLIYNSGNPVSGKSGILNTLANGEVLTIPAPVFVVIAVAIVALLLMHRMSFGRSVYAIGTNPRAALLSGVPIARIQILNYMFSGICAGITGLLILGWTSYSFLNMGDPYLLSSVAAVVIGGTSILGGKGKYIGTIAGALILTIFVNILTVMQIPDAGRQMVQGGLILVLLLAYAYSPD